MHVDIFKKKITTERARGEREFGEFGLERENRRSLGGVLKKFQG